MSNKEPKFIKEVRRKVAEEAQGRPDAATYEEAGNAALNMVLAHWLNLDSLNPELVREEATKGTRASYERKLQRAANQLAQEKLAHGDLKKNYERLLSQVAGPPTPGVARSQDEVAEIVHGLRGKIGQLEGDLAVALLAASLGVPVSKKQLKARTVKMEAEHLQLSVENRALKKQLAELLAASESPAAE